MRLFPASLVFFLAAAGCVRRDGRNSDCRWPAEIGGHSADARHLSEDAEFAEDLAIRYGDIHHGLGTPNYVSGAAYGAAKDRCMGSLFAQIAKAHGVPVEHVSGALRRNRAYIDAAEILPFALIYCFAATAVARLIWRKYPPAENGWIPGAAMALFLSLMIATGGTMLGEVWSGIAESYRIGNSHMSYRLQRLWWVGHRTELFAGAMMVFWSAAAATAGRLNKSSPAD